jgi:predicted dehydrogenase
VTGCKGNPITILTQPMKQLQQNYNTGETVLSDVPRPVPGRSEVLVRNAASLISAGTEKMVVDIARKSALGKARARPDLVRQVLDKVRTEGLWSTVDKVRSKLETPIPLGYSIAGTVVEAGAGADVPVGTRVACGGAGIANHAEYNAVPKILTVSVPERIAAEDASFVTVGAIALQGVRQAAPTIGERVGVIGLGLIGQLTVQILKANGCDVVGTDVDPWKGKLAIDCGADLTVLPENFVASANAFTHDHGLDAVIIAASTQSDQPVHDAGLASRRKGRVISVGLTNLNVPRDLYYYKELDLRLSHAYGPGRHDPQYEYQGIDYPFEYVRWTEQRNFEAFLRLVETGKVTPARLITHRFPFEDALSAYELMMAGSEPYLGIVLTYSTHESSRPDRTITVFRQAPTSPVPKADVAIAAIGTGGFAKSVLLPRFAVRKDIARVVAASRSGMSARHAADRFHFSDASTDYTETFGRDDVNAVVIATRHNSHASLVEEAITLGKHVFVEKPLALNEAELSALVDRHEGGSIVQVGFNRRFSSHAVRARKKVAGRQAVLNYRVNAGEIPSDSWIHDLSIGGGRIVGEVCHFIDFSSFVLDSEPRTVASARILEKTTHDDIVITITYQNGSLATITYLAKGNPRVGKEWIEVFAENTVVQIDNFRSTAVYSGSRRRVYKTRRQDKGFDQEVDAFIASIRNGQPAIPFESLVSTTRATFAAVKSLGTLQPVDV